MSNKNVFAADMWRLRQEDLEIEASLGYTVISCLKKKKQKQTNKQTKKNKAKQNKMKQNSGPYICKASILPVIYH